MKCSGVYIIKLISKFILEKDIGKKNINIILCLQIILQLLCYFCINFIKLYMLYDGLVYLEYVIIFVFSVLNFIGNVFVFEN